jgi:DNA-binding transcriptional MerR regulator
MFSPLEFARVGMVPVHVLRGLEVAGLLVPRRFGPGHGRRWYDTSQLARLNQILVLTDLGFTFPQVRAILNTRMSEPELRGVLRLRQAELAARVSADAARLERVDARLSAIAGEAPGEPAGDGADWWTTPAQRGRTGPAAQRTQQRMRAWRRPHRLQLTGS